MIYSIVTDCTSGKNAAEREIFFRDARFNLAFDRGKF
jgi:hypothetical protein